MVSTSGEGWSVQALHVFDRLHAFCIGIIFPQFLTQFVSCFDCGLGMVSTLAGSGAASWVDGIGTAARLNGPEGVVVSFEGDVFFADSLNHRIRMISTSGLYCH